MPAIAEPHRLLILSQDEGSYRHLISQAELPGLSIRSTNSELEGISIGQACDLLFGEPALVSKVINPLAQLTWVQSTWAGVEPLMADGMRRDYILTNARNVYGPMLSEYVFGYLLAIERGILPRWQAQQFARWDDTTPGTLRGKLLGLLGVGSIGAHLAATARHFQMHVYGYTRQSETCGDVEKYFHGGQWQDFASDLDYLVCSLPGTQETSGLVNAGLIGAVKPKTWLVNVGRGSTIDEAALVEALTRHDLAGAILDVFVQEPLPAGHPLWTTPNTFITCHTAARNYLPDIANLFIENYRRLLVGKPLLNRVDFMQGY
jgi:phosphoglycerate dehydrogenase-like enzyme